MHTCTSGTATFPLYFSFTSFCCCHFTLLPVRVCVSAVFISLSKCSLYILAKIHFAVDITLSAPIYQQQLAEQSGPHWLVWQLCVCVMCGAWQVCDKYFEQKLCLPNRLSLDSLNFLAPRILKTARETHPVAACVHDVCVIL